MAPEIGISKVNFAFIAQHHAPIPWNELNEKENNNVICFSSIKKGSKWNESNKPVKHCIKIESKKKPWNDVNSKESTSHFKYDQKQRADNIQSNSINLSVISQGQQSIDKERALSLYSDNLSYTSKKKQYNQMNISELRFSFDTKKKQWNEVCDLYPNEYFSVKTIPRQRQTYQNERREEQNFTVKSIKPNLTPSFSSSIEKNTIAQCQGFTFETQSYYSLCEICKDINCKCKCHVSPSKQKT